MLGNRGNKKRPTEMRPLGEEANTLVLRLGVRLGLAECRGATIDHVAQPAADKVFNCHNTIVGDVQAASSTGVAATSTAGGQSGEAFAVALAGAGAHIVVGPEAARLGTTAACQFLTGLSCLVARSAGHINVLQLLEAQPLAIDGYPEIAQVNGVLDTAG